MKRIAALLRRRLAGAVPVLFIVVAFAFLLLESAPGDAVDAYLVSVGGGDATLAANLRAQYGLDQSTLSRLRLYLAALAHFDLGWSVAFDRPVLSLICERLPTTLVLMGSATLLSFGLGSFLGIVAASHPGSLRDRLLSMASLTLYAIPGFWLALLLLIVFAVDLRWLPFSGFETVASHKTGLARLADIARHLVLPVVTLSLIYLALYLRVMRAAMGEVWRQDFIHFARARGLSARRILWRHVARNALLPLVTVLGLQSAAMLGGSIIIESVFAIPGFGRLAQEAVAGRDAPLLVGLILVSALFVLSINLVVDLLYAWLDPRVGSVETR